MVENLDFRIMHNLEQLKAFIMEKAFLFFLKDSVSALIDLLLSLPPQCFCLPADRLFVFVSF